MFELIKIAGLGAVLSYAVASAYHQPLHKLESAVARPPETERVAGLNSAAVLPPPAHQRRRAVAIW